MSNPNHPRLAKTILHGRPTGEISQTEIDQRADEIAEIEGHRTVSSDDRARAQEEMTGSDIPATTAEEVETTASLSRDPSDPVAIHGKATPNISEPNEQEELEHLVLDGVEEAQHDQMLEARKRRQP